MATLVCFHAHPDDEAIATGGTIRKAVAEGHRVVLVVATKGEQGEPVPGVLNEGEELWQRRVEETYVSAKVLGVHRVEFLGYEDSGMMGEPENDNEACFWQADRHEAATRLAALLQEEAADVLTIYDPNGGYGHPDHIQVHRVGTDAAELAGVERVLWATMNRTRIAAQMAAAAEHGDTAESDRASAVDAPTFGMPEEELTHAIDVSEFVDAKKRSMRSHASQISEDAFFFAMPDEVFSVAFGTEWFADPRKPRTSSPFSTSLFA